MSWAETIQEGITKLIKQEVGVLTTKLNGLLLRTEGLEQRVSKLGDVSTPDGVLQFVLKIPGIIDETAKSIISKIDGLYARVTELEKWRAKHERILPPPQGGCPPPPQKPGGIFNDDHLDDIVFAHGRVGEVGQ